MKKTLTLSLFIAFFTLSLSAQEATSLVGSWKYQSEPKGGDEKRMFYSSQFEFKNDGKFVKVKSGIVIEGTWSSKDSNKTVVINDGDPLTLTIKELSKDKLVFKCGSITYTMVKTNSIDLSSPPKKIRTDIKPN